MLQRPHDRGGVWGMSCDLTFSAVLGGTFNRQVARTWSPAWFARMLVGLLYATIFSWSHPAYAFSPSTECTPATKSFTVVSGGSNFVDLSSCSIFGLDKVAVAPSHGSLTGIDPVNGNGTSQFTYVNNGDGALSDTFTVLDDSNGAIVFNVTVGAAGPTISAVSPSSGTTAGGTSVTLTGAGFTGATAVHFGATSAASYTVNSATSITATSPAGSAGVVDVTVTGTGGTSATGASDHFTFVAPPVANAVSATVAHGSSSNPVTLNITGGTATSVAVASAASHGTATASGTTITYTPVASYSGTDTFSYTATNTVGTSSPATVTITVSSAAISYAPGNPAAGAVGVAYSQSVASASGGTGPYTYTLASGALPAGVSLSSAGTLSGTPTAGGTFNFTITATDSSSGTGPFSTTSSTLSLTISAPSLSISPISGTALSGTAPASYSQSFTPSGGIAPYTYALVINSGTMPTGLSFNTGTGTLSGTPTTAGSVHFTVTATDSTTGAGPYAIAGTYTLTVSAPAISLAPTTLPTPTTGASYSQTVTASGGTAAYTYAVSAGALPNGLSLNTSTGAISGTPTAAGTFSFTIQATDANSFTGSRAYSVTVGAPTLALTPATIPGAAVASAYTATFSASAGTAPYSYTLVSGSLPSGISLNTSTGVLSGTTVVAGSFPITVRATDSSTGTGPFTVQNGYTLVVAAPTISLSPTTLPTPATGASYSQTVTASGGTAAYTYAVSAGALPNGLSLNTSTGAISGTPTGAGTFSFTIQATDANSFTGSRAYSVTVGAPTLILTPATLPAPAAEVAYSTALTASGGTAPYSYAVISGALPAGLSLNSATGVLSGTPTQSGSFSVTIGATDNSTGTGAPFSASHSYTLVVGAPTVTLIPAGALTAGKVNVAYSQQFTASGGVGPYAYTVSTGSLPAGLTLSGSGLLSGTPTAYGSFGFTVVATDAHSFTGQTAVTLAVSQAQPVAVNDSATTLANQIATVNVTANDSGVITSIAIISPPTHGTATVSSLNVVYTPSSNYFGSDSLTYAATGPGGTSAPATVTFTVTPLAVPVAIAQSAAVLAGQPVTVHTANGASGGPFVGVTMVTQPSVGAVTVNGTDIVYTSVIGSSGAVKFSYTLANAFGASAAVTATITVNPMPVVGTHSASVLAGAAVNVDLMAGATGGPFTAAAVVTVSPPTAGTAVIRDIGAAGKPSYQMTFTAATTFAGSAAIGYTLSNAYATSAPGTVTVTVMPRRDMSTDPEVIGLLSAQADSARRFASAQTSNFTRRLESLHGDGWGHSAFGLSIAPTPNGLPVSDAAQWPNSDVDRVVGSPWQPQMRKVGWQQQPGAAQAASADAMWASADTQAAISGLPDLPPPHENDKQRLSLWVGGAVDFGQQSMNGRQPGFKFTTDGVSLGGDYRISDLATFGIGTGFSRDSTDIGNNGTTSTAESVVLAMYGSLRPAKNVFIDGVLGYGTLNFDGTRYITGDGGFATGSRSGDQLFGAIVTGIEYHGEGWMWSPYGRLELMSATLDQYSETASGLNALTYFKQTVHSSSATLGVRAEGQYVSSIGTWIPRARLEFSHQFQGAEDATLAYADLAAAGPAYTVQTVNQEVGNWTAGLGAQLLMHHGLTLTIDYSSNVNTGVGHSQSIMFMVAVPLK